MRVTQGLLELEQLGESHVGIGFDFAEHGEGDGIEVAFGGARFSKDVGDTDVAILEEKEGFGDRRALVDVL